MLLTVYNRMLQMGGTVVSVTLLAFTGVAPLALASVVIQEAVKRQMVVRPRELDLGCDRLYLTFTVTA